MTARPGAVAPAARADALARLHPLPSPRGAALEILRRSLREDVSIADLARLAQGDPALAGRLLKAANAAGTAGARPVGTLQEAILRLGVPGAARLALAFSLVGDHRGGACRGFDYPAFWTGALVRGLAARAAATALEVRAPEEAFCCGLLSAVGRLALACAFPVRYAELAGLRDAGEALAAERAGLGIDHAELGDALLADWGFPPGLRAAVAAHRDPDAAPADGGPRVQLMARALQLADAIAESAVREGEEKAAASAAAAALAARLGLDAEALRAIGESAGREAAAWAALLEVPAPQAPLLASASPLPVVDGEGERVLVVDGDERRGAALAAVLGAHGYRPSVARDADAALVAFLAYRPHALVADRATPGLDPAALCRALRATHSGAALHLVLLDDAAAPLLAPALEAGADDVLSRHADERLLLARLGAGLRARRRSEALERELAALRATAADLASEARLLQDAVRIDRDTGLPDRRLALERLAQECASAARRRSPLACLVLEPDGPAPDARAMGEAARRLRAASRATDTVCRLGEAEFLVVAPDTDPGEAAVLGTRLRARLREALAGAASVGVAAVPFGDCAPHELLRRAERALLASRLAGGDRVSEYGARLRRVS